LPAVAVHLQGEGRAVVQSGAQIVLCEGRQRQVVLELGPLTCPVLGLPPFLVDDLLAAVAAAVALDLSPDQIRSGIQACVGQGGPAVFELPVTPRRPDGGLLIVTPGRNPSAFQAWGEHLRQFFVGRRAGIVVESATDWRATDAPLLADGLGQCFSEVTLVVNSGEGALVEALDTTKPPPDPRLAGRSTPLMDAVDQLLAAGSVADLLCVCPSNAASFSKVLGYLDDQGVTRRRVGGLASVRHCR
jgi:hypothetical protein